MKVIKRGYPIQEQDLVDIGDVVELHEYSKESPVKVVAMARRPNSAPCEDCCLRESNCGVVSVKTKRGFSYDSILCQLNTLVPGRPAFCIFKTLDELLEDL